MIMMPYGRCWSSLQLTGTQISGTPQARQSPKPVIEVILSGPESDRVRGELGVGGVPVLSSPAGAVEALHQLRRFARTAVLEAAGTAACDAADPVRLRGIDLDPVAVTADGELVVLDAAM